MNSFFSLPINLTNMYRFPQSGVYIGPVSSVPLILFSGFFINFNVMPYYVQMISYISYIRYGFEGAMLSMYSYDREPLKCPEKPCLDEFPMDILKGMSMESAEYWIDAVALFGLLITVRIVAYLLLRFKLHLLR